MGLHKPKTMNKSLHRKLLSVDIIERYYWLKPEIMYFLYTRISLNRIRVISSFKFILWSSVSNLICTLDKFGIIFINKINIIINLLSGYKSNMKIIKIFYHSSASIPDILQIQKIKVEMIRLVNLAKFV